MSCLRKFSVVTGLCPKICHVYENLLLLLDYALKYAMFTKICYWTTPYKYDMFTII